MPTSTGTAGNDSWTVINPGSYLLDGLGGTDTLSLGTSLRSSYTLTLGGDGAIEIDTVSGASETVHISAYNIEKLVFNNGRDVIDVASFFGIDPGHLKLNGGPGNDTFTAPATSMAFDGGGGLDSTVFAQARSAYTLAPSSTGYVAATTNNAARYELTSIERLSFSDAKLALDLDGHAGQVAKLIGAVFGAASVKLPDYVGIGLQLADGGTNYEGLAQVAIDARLGPGASNTAIVTLLYTNVVGTAPSAAELAYYVGLLDSHAYTPASLTVLAADTTLNQAQIDLAGLMQTGLLFT